jgi:anthranilate synthase component 1
VVITVVAWLTTHIVFSNSYKTKRRLIMVFPTCDDLKVLAKQGNLAPVWCELPADLETPVSVYLKLRESGPSFLLESVARGEQLGRYSFLGVRPAGWIIGQDNRVHHWSRGCDRPVELPGEDPLTAMKGLLSGYRPVPLDGPPGFCGGLVGYLGYDAVRFFERVPTPFKSELDLPDAIFLLADNLVIYDHVKHRLIVLVNAHLEGDIDAVYADAVTQIDNIIAQLKRPVTELSEPIENGVSIDQPWTANYDQARFEADVRRAKEHITDGDILQVVLAQRLSHRTAVDPFAIYRSLRMLNPSPYMYYLELPGDLRVIGSSPETLVKLQGRKAEVRPIAGTRPRGIGIDEDESLAEELLADPKERAEHVMLIDLGRNDLGRVCRYGSVRVTEMMTIERYSHVMHIVSSVQGELNPGVDSFDLMRAVFPAGTVSGAPKVRAMEILAELEGERRGPYAGGVGYFSYSGDMDTCITIRTIVMQGDTVHVQAGAGIVADSDPTREYHETLHKAQALAEAIRIAERGELVLERSRSAGSMGGAT